MAVKCSKCWVEVVDLGRDRRHGGQIIECPDCKQTWSQGHSMTGPEWHFMSLDKDGNIEWPEIQRYLPVDTLDPNVLFYLALIVIITCAAVWSSIQ